MQVLLLIRDDLLDLGRHAAEMRLSMWNDVHHTLNRVGSGLIDASSWWAS